MLLSTLSKLVSCSTVFIHINITLDIHDSDSSVVLSSQPWRNLDVMQVPDCGIIIIHESWLKATLLPVARSRLKASLVVVTETKVQELQFFFNSNKKLNFDVYLVQADEGNSNLTANCVEKMQANALMYLHSIVKSVIVSIKTLNFDGKAKSREITGTYTVIPPYIINPTPPQPTGLDPDIMNLLSRKRNIKVYFKPVKDYTDLIKLVLLGHADMALSQPNLVIQRYRLGLDISPALTFRRFIFVKRHPVPVDKMYTIVYPFSKGVWLATVATTVAVLVTLGLLNKYDYDAKL